MPSGIFRTFSVCDYIPVKGKISITIRPGLVQLSSQPCSGMLFNSY